MGLMAEAYVLKQVEHLRKEINRHNYRYHALDDPVISDARYDSLVAELLELESQHPDLITTDSPTQRVGVAPAERFSQVEHVVPMLSLGNAFSYQEMETWYRRVTNLLGGASFDMVCELKIDGLAVALTYRGGRLVRGATRGDGYRGEDVTQNLRTVRSIPLTFLNLGPQNLEVRGEVYMPTEAFNKINSERKSQGEALYANPRNTAAGSVRQLDPMMTASRRLEIYIYALGYVEGYGMANEHWEMLRLLGELGFRINPHNKLCRTLEEVESWYKYWLELRHELSFQVDGMVVKVNLLEHQAELGNSGREPRWAIAYKFPAEQVITRLIDIGINVGRTGSLNPFAILDPVVVSGATVKMASLHNQDDIHRKDIRINDWVTVERAGEVIPQVLGPVKTRRNGNEKIFLMPDQCPICSTLIVKSVEEALHRCPNRGCPAQFFESLKHFVSKEAMDVDGLGGRWCRVLIDEGLVGDVAALYKLDKQQLLSLDRMGDKLSSKIVHNINGSKGRPFSRVIYALGIVHVGSEIADVLVSHMGNIDDLAAASQDDLTGIPRIGPKIAASIVSYFSIDDNRRVVEELRRAGVNLAENHPVLERLRLPLSEKIFCLTGTLSSMPRSEAEAKIRALGGSASSNVSRKTSYLLVGADPGSKLGTAQRLGVTIMNETQFLELLQGKGWGVL